MAARSYHGFKQRYSYLVLDQVIATARRCHGSQSVSWLIVKITPTRPGAPGSPDIARGGRIAYPYKVITDEYVDVGTSRQGLTESCSHTG